MKSIEEGEQVPTVFHAEDPRLVNSALGNEELVAGTISLVAGARTRDDVPLELLATAAATLISWEDGSINLGASRGVGRAVAKLLEKEPT